LLKKVNKKKLKHPDFFKELFRQGDFGQGASPVFDDKQ